MTQKATIAVIGNPNCGKTTLFNVFTGSRQKVGNWPGVTVDKKLGQLKIAEQTHTLVDLPGTYSLEALAQDVSTDEQIARDFLMSGEADLIINIIDASNLNRNLYLTSELLDMQVPIICALNMTDVAKKHGIHIDADNLSEQLGVPVVAITASSGKGLDELRTAIKQSLLKPSASNPIKRSQQDLQAAIDAISAKLEDAPAAAWRAQRLLEGERTSDDGADAELLGAAAELRERMEAAHGQPMDILLARARYEAIERVLSTAVKLDESSSNVTEAIDRVVLNRWIGIPFFLLVMYLMFVFAINVGGAFIGFFDIAFAAVFVDGTREVLSSFGTPEWLTTLLADGLGGGIQLVATFIPVIAGLYLFLSLIEDSGYMARAAFVMDRLMRSVGLPGKSFVPLIVGFGCNVPAVMAARTMDTHKDRLLTIAMAPFMSCGARLAVYALFAAAFFPTNGAIVVFSLYLLGIIMAMVTGMALKHTLFKPELTPFVMELPSYHLPTVKGVLLKTWDKLKSFITRAGKTIVIVVIALSFLNSIGTDGSFGNENTDNSALSKVAQVFTPALAPLGVQSDNWAATVGVITGVFAKEAVVGTLDALYTPVTGEGADYDLSAQLSEALATIPANLSDMAGALTDPLGLSIVSEDQTEAQGVQSGTFAAMGQLFGSGWAAYSYLVFVLLYTPCVATLGAMTREAGLRWMLFVAGWTTGLAYTCAVITYQLAMIASAPLSAFAWIFGCLGFIVFGLWRMRVYGRKGMANRIPTQQI